MRIKAVFIIYAIIMLISFIGPIIVENFTGYEITDYVANVEVLENGDLLVKEYMVIDGSLNGYRNNLYYKNTNINSENKSTYYMNPIYDASDITDIKVAVFDGKVTEQPDNIDYFERTSYASNGESGVYTLNNLVGGYEIKIFNKLDNETATFYMEYIIDDAIVIHNDIAELYHNFFSSGFTDDIENVEINIILPEEADEVFKYYGHGGLHGEIKAKDNVVTATMEEYFAGEDLDIRVLFDKEMITDTSSLDTMPYYSLENIMEIEDAKAYEADLERQRIIDTERFYAVANILYLVGLVALIMYVYFFHDRELKADFNLKYNREFIDEYGVEVVSYLMNKKKIVPDAMSASIMNLIYKKNISVIKLDKNNYAFSLENNDGCSDAENLLIDFLFKTVGDGKSFSTKSLKKYAESSKTCDSFTASYSNWKNHVVVEGEKQLFYEKHTNVIIFGIIYAVIGILLWFSSLDKIVTTNIHLGLVALCIVFIIYVCTFDKRTKRGNEHYARWSAFKNFLNDFGTFETKDLPEIILWERYLVYATVFGIADKVQDVMNVRINEIDTSGTIAVLPSDILIFNNSMHMNSIITNSINKSISSAFRASAAKAAAAAASSGRGGGGGFSGGGGGGGGGRGGGGF